MALGRRAIFALFVVLLLAPITSFSIAPFAHNLSDGTPNQINALSSPATNTSNETATIPISIPSVLTRSLPLGAVSPTIQVSLGVLVPPKDQVGLEQYINEVNTPSSSQYRHFLTPQQYAETYGPSGQEELALGSFFASKGFSVSFDKWNPNLMLVSGTAGATEKSLHVSIESFKLGGTTFYSATSGIELPSQFSNIQTVFGLTNYGVNASATPMYKVLGEVNSTAATTTSTSVYYSPSELRQIYNESSLLNAGYTGSGVTIAITDAYGDPYIQQELNNFSSEFSLPQTTINVICVDGPCNYASGITAGWNTEIALDVEWAHAMAPRAAINLYIASNSSFPLFDAVQRAVSDGNNSIISMSWGSPENSFAQSSPVAPVFGPNYPWLDQVFQEAAAQGITAFASSGDWGAYDQSQGETLPYGGAVYPSTDPYVTSVGGTSLYMNATSGYLQFPYSNATGTYSSETAWSWSDYFGGATGGGYSTLFPAPTWQSGPGFSGSARGAPDVSWDADPSTGVLVSIADGSGGYTYYIVGGTSVGSPSWAGSLATIEQKAGMRLGLITPQLYSILNNPSQYAKAFHDVTVGNNNPTSAGVGWDPLTGIGSPNLGELAGLLAPTGSLSVSLGNSLSGSLAQSYAYGNTIALAAKVTSGPSKVSSGTVTGIISGPAGQEIANVPFTFSASSDTWNGYYTIKPTDPSGMWTATVSASSGSLFGRGYSTFSVGDGVTMFLPFYNFTTETTTPVFLLTGEKINVTAQVTSPNGQCCVSQGSYHAIFTLNSPSGKLEGNVSLSYDPGTKDWKGSFLIPRSADQGAWVITVNGTDSSGNLGSAYSWLNVGLNVLLTTDSPSYISGDKVTIYAAPEYPGGLITALGSFNATVTSGSQTIATVPMSFNWLYALWMGTFTVSSSDPLGFYTVTVGGNDGAGNSGSFSTIIRVAPYHLDGVVTLPSRSISINGGSEPTVSAKITYPNGTVMSSGSVEAFVSLEMDGTFVPIGHSRMSYQSSSQSFVGPNILTPASVLKTTPGEYLVSIQTLDPLGNYGNFSSTFFVNANSHSAISISSDSQFTSANGVISGAGTQSSPFIIAGWNASSISISSNVTSSFELLNDWVEGSSGNGIVINTPSSAHSLVENDFSISNHGNGLVISDSPGISIYRVDSSNNSGSGIVISNVPKGTGGLVGSVAANNGLDGVVIDNSTLYTVSTSSATNNANHGFYLYNSMNATLYQDNATSNVVGAYFTGTLGAGYGEGVILGGNFIANHIGIGANGLFQNIKDNSTTLSTLTILETAQIQNNIGTLAANDSVITLETNVIGLSDYGVVIQNSLPLIANDIVTQNAKTGVNVTGAFSGTGHCIISFTNSTTLDYSSCIALNYLTLNGESGLQMSNLNGSFVFQDAAVGNTGNGFSFASMTGSLFSNMTSILNEKSGLLISDSASNTLSANQLGGNLYGMIIKNSMNDTFNENNATLNALDGMLFSGSSNNTISGNIAIEDAGACLSLTSCSVAAGIELSSSSDNLVTGNQISNNTAPTGQGAGIYLNSGSTGNIILQNNLTLNFAGVSISSSNGNSIAKNIFISDTYGVYLSNSPNNVISINNFHGLKQFTYPDRPSVSFSSLSAGASYSGRVELSWSVQGQAISSENLIIDGRPQSVQGTNFTLDSATLSDGTHILTINVTNSGGFSAYSTVEITTRNHEGLLVQAVGPNGVPLSGVNVEIRGPGGLLNGTTDSNGGTLFKDLSAGTYLASTTVNGSVVSVPVHFGGNETVILYVPNLTTIVSATTPSGAKVSLTLNGNITADNISNLSLENSNGVYSVSFTVSGINGTLGETTLTIPKSFAPGGMVPQIIINGNPAKFESFTQNSRNYIVTFATILGSQTSVSIQFEHLVRINLDLVIVLVVIIAILAGLLAFAFRKPRWTTY
jgi:parallel beta-helix repeat protein